MRPPGTGCKKIIPLFSCPDKKFEEIYYFRWWTLRKHIIQTPQGFAITEFLIKRSYADKYNLISSGLGHHIYEARWLHNQQYLDDDLLTWYRGNEGKPLKKLRFYSSWNSDAIYNRFLVNGNTAFVKNLLPDLQADYQAWEDEKRYPGGLFWQYDVRDAMEETISGGRKEKIRGLRLMAICTGTLKPSPQLQCWRVIPHCSIYIRKKRIP